MQLAAKTCRPAAASPADAPPPPPPPPRRGRRAVVAAPPGARGAVIVLPSESVCSALFTTVGALAGVCAASSQLSTQPAARPSAATTPTNDRATISLRTMHTPRLG